MGISTKFEMVSGKFELSEEVTTTQLVDGKYSLAPLYKVTLLTTASTKTSSACRLISTWNFYVTLEW